MNGKHKPKDTARKKTFREPLTSQLREEIKNDLAKDGFNVEPYFNQYARLEDKLEYSDVTFRERIGSYGAISDMLRSGLEQIEKIRQDPNSNVAQRESADPFYRAGLKKYLATLKKALLRAEEAIEVIKEFSPAENVVIDDLWEDGFDIEKLETAIDSGFDVLEDAGASEKRSNLAMTTVINEYETALHHIEEIRNDPSSRTSRREETDPKYTKALDDLVLRLREQQKDLKHFHGSRD